MKTLKEENYSKNTFKCVFSIVIHFTNLLMYQRREDHLAVDAIKKSNKVYYKD